MFGGVIEIVQLYIGQKSCKKIVFPEDANLELQETYSQKLFVCSKCAPLPIKRCLLKSDLERIFLPARDVDTSLIGESCHLDDTLPAMLMH